MLECGANFKATMPEICKQCKVRDDENHRLNQCEYVRQQYGIEGVERFEFHDIYSENADILNDAIERIEKVWEFRYANGRMKKVLS